MNKKGLAESFNKQNNVDSKYNLGHYKESNLIHM